MEAMKEAKHTPGPWTVTTCWSQTCGEGYFIEQDHQREEEMDANARLIAAAPELLEALRTARTRMLRYGEDPREIAEIDAAIAKAEGTSPESGAASSTSTMQARSNPKT